MKARSGMTLAEVLISMVVLSIVLAGALCCVTLAGNAMRASTASTRETSQSNRILNQISAELQVATGFSERTATAVTFTIPDRDGDAQAETIRYSWSGAAGDPLYRRYNSEAAVVVAANVRELSFDFLTEDVEPLTTTSEGVISEHEDSRGGHTYDDKLSRSNWLAQYFTPVLPDGAVSYRITKVALYCKREKNDNQPFEISLVYPTGGRTPSTTVLETVPVNPQSMGKNWAWREFTFTNQVQLSPAQAMCVVISQDHYSKTATFRYERDGREMTPNAHYITSWNCGMSWSSVGNSEDMLYKVYAEVTK